MSYRAYPFTTVFCVLLFALGCTGASPSVDRPKESTSQNNQHDPEHAPLVEGILFAWNQADLVCLGEDHGSKQDSDLRIALVNNPQFARIVKVIVVEFANPVHQDVLDRFVLEGKEVPHDELASVWRDASNPQTWDSPVYEAFLRAVREVNQHLPIWARLMRSQRVRVVGGDSPIDWKKISTPEQLAPLLNRNGNIHNILAQQVLEKHVKALAIYGSTHCEKATMGFPYAPLETANLSANADLTLSRMPPRSVLNSADSRGNLMLGRIILGLALVVASTYLARITRNLSHPSSRRRDSKSAEGPKPLLWIVFLAYVPLLGIQFFLMHIDAVHGGHEVWPVDILASVGLTCGVVWLYWIAKIRSRQQ